jgi:hypothetical protein
MKSNSNGSPLHIEIDNEPLILNSDRPRSLQREEPIESIEQFNATMPTQPAISYAEPLLIDRNQPRVSSNRVVLHQYDSSYDIGFNEWNQREISDRLRKMTSVIKEHPYNHYIVSAYHRAYEYYEESTLIKGYDRNNSDWSIRPNAFLYRINDDPDNPINNYELRLFSFNVHSVALQNHRRQDILHPDHNLSFMSMTYHCAEKLCGAIVSYKEPFTHPNFSVTDHRYISAGCAGHYYSTMSEYSDYVRMIEATVEMDYDTESVTNTILTDTLLLVMIWDIHVWVSQVLSSITFSIQGVAFLRKMILDDIHRVKSRTIENLELFKVFNYIVTHVSPYETKEFTYANSRYIREYQNRFPQGCRVTYLCPESVIKSCNILMIFSMYVSSSLMGLRQNQQRLINDTGASVSATSNKHILKNIQPCTDMIAYPAFGPQIAPKLRGEFGKFGLETVLIDDMPDTLISVSQICEGGLSKKHNVAIFTTEGVRIFKYDSIRKALKIIDSTGVEVLRGLAQDGVYVTENENNTINTHSLFLAKFKPVSLYDHIHLVTNHPGERGMKWHRENSINGNYPDIDVNRKRGVNRNRGVCRGCVYGSLHQTPTDPYRDHRPIPLIPGQCFVLDAYTHPIRVTISV